MSSTSAYELYCRLKGLPGGRRLFSMGYARKAPYFRSIRPHVRGMRLNRAEIYLPKRRAVLNHLGTVHAIAVCNGLEAAMGLLAEASTPPGHRWIPVEMQVEYLARSTTGLVCVAETSDQEWSSLPRVPVRVSARRDDGTVVARGTITLRVTPYP